jgi:hypothetical protein
MVGSSTYDFVSNARATGASSSAYHKPVRILRVEINGIEREVELDTRTLEWRSHGLGRRGALLR